MFTKKYSKKGLAFTSFVSLCLRTHSLLTFIMLLKCNLFFPNNLGKQKARELKNALVTVGTFSTNFCSNQSEFAKRSTLFHSR